MPTATVCACSSCKCEVEPKDAIQKEGQYYCSKQCAEGHANHTGCGHAGCTCDQ